MSGGVAVLGAGAFGTALASALARAGRPVALWGRDAGAMAALAAGGESARLPGVRLPPEVTATADLAAATRAATLLVALPTQQLAAFLATHAGALDGRTLILCCKGLDRVTGLRPSRIAAEACPSSPIAVLTGPSFAADIARGLPTALVLACDDEARGASLQEALANPVTRLYRTTDVAGAELGGALKNVIALGAGIVIGAGLGESARAALMTRGFAEITRLAVALGARPETLSGLSGLGDLVLTCTSAQSRNFAHGVALGQGSRPEKGRTVEGLATAEAVMALAGAHGLDMPVCETVRSVSAGRLGVAEARAALLARPLKEE